MEGVINGLIYTIHIPSFVSGVRFHIVKKKSEFARFDPTCLNLLTVKLVHAVAPIALLVGKMAAKLVYFVGCNSVTPNY